MFAVVLLLTLAFLGLYWLGARQAFEEVDGLETPPPGRRRADGRRGATLLGLAMFGTLFLGAVLAVFLTLGAVRGDAERGLLQPLVVRPLGRACVPRRPLPRRRGRLRRRTCFAVYAAAC